MTTYRCPACGKVLAKHDDGYQHWLVCPKRKKER